MAGGGGAERGTVEQRRRAIGAVAAIGLLAVASILALTGGHDDSRPSPQAAARIVRTADVEDLERSLGHPLYWAGPRAAEDLELSVEADGSVYLRYLPPGARPGDPRQFLTVGTYPVADAQAALRRTAAADGTQVDVRGDGSVVLLNPSSSGSVYLAYPGSDLEIEVYDPQPGRALELIRSGAIEQVGG